MAEEAAVEVAPLSAQDQKIAELTALVEKALAVRAVAPVVESKPGLAIRAWLKTKSVASALKGARTLLFFGVTALVGLADAFSAIDLSSLSEHYIGTKIKFGDIITVMSVAGILLRFITKTPAFARWQKAAESGGVDEPTDAA
jgi:hypothetical protein